MMTRILFPHLLFVTLAAVAQGVLNVRKQFFLPALAPCMFSVSILMYLTLAFAGWMPLPEPNGQLYGLAAVAMLGGLFTLAFLARPVAREGMGYRPGPAVSP